MVKGEFDAKDQIIKEIPYWPEKDVVVNNLSDLNERISAAIGNVARLDTKTRSNSSLKYYICEVMETLNDFSIILEEVKRWTID